MIKPVTHLRLTIVPDGGVARFRAYGEAAPVWDSIPADQVVDLVSLKLGGRVVTASNMHYGYPDAMLAPGHAKVMGEGWETRRKREAAGASVLTDPMAVMNDPDWAIVKLGHPGTIRSITLDTALYKGNFPDRAFIEGTDDIDSGTWTMVLPETALAASTEFHFDHQIKARGPFTHLRLSIIPDGGISRFRVHGLKVAV